MAMLPFCGYNMADYWAHWLDVGRRVSNPPRLFQVNWFRKDDDGKFIWPGFGENMRVLRWVRDVVNGRAEQTARETPIGIMPTPEAVGARDIGLSDRQIEQLLDVDREEWLAEAADQRAFLEKFGDRLPPEMRAENDALIRRLRD
jgi:phosphoenolpyruvate carboxykinase (GTP)